MDRKLVQLAVVLYEKLKSGHAVAKRLDVSGSTAYRLLAAGGVGLPDRHGAEIQERKKKFHGDLAKAVAKDYERGMSAVDLRKKYGASMWAIRTAVKDAGVTMRGRGGKYRAFSEEDRAEAVKLYREGWSQAQIAAKFGAHQVTASRMLQEAGCVTRKRGGKDHGSWKGGLVPAGSGYLKMMVERDDPLISMADGAGYVLEHRLVMARSLGRQLLPHETVHHINGDKKDNKLKNLQLRFGKHGNGAVMVCAKCGSHEITYKELS